jgi:site-specific recombinase XerD
VINIIKGEIVVFSVKSPNYTTCYFHPFNNEIIKLNAKGHETLYSDEGKYLKEFNHWIHYLVNIKKAKDVSAHVRALKKYFSFLEHNKLQWNKFPSQKHLRPTYLFRNQLLLKEVKQRIIKASTASLYINIVVQFYLWAIHEKLIDIDNDHTPFEFELVKVPFWSSGNFSNRSFVVKTTDLKISAPRLTEDQTLNPLTKDELSCYFKTLKSCNEPFIIHQLLQIQSGLRIEEACTFPANLVFLPKNNQMRHEVEIGPHLGVHTKLGGIKKIEIPQTLMMRMYKYLISEKRGRLVDKSDRHEDLNCPLLLNSKGQDYSSQNVQRYFSTLRKEIRNKYGIPFEHRTHDLRSTYGTYRLASILENGINPIDAMRLVMGWLGHKNEHTTWKYLRYLNKQQLHQQAIFMLDSLVEEVLSV